MCERDIAFNIWLHDTGYLIMGTTLSLSCCSCQKIYLSVIIDLMAECPRLQIDQA